MIPLTTTNQVVTGAAQVVGLAVLAATIAASITVGYRWVTREQVPVGLALLGGLAGVAVYVSATPTLGEVIGGETSALRAALYNIVAFAVSAGSAVGGHRFGDGFARDVLFSDPVTETDQSVSELLETVGRVTVVDIPERVDDVVGYDPVTVETKDALAGERFVFPQPLTRAEIDERVRSRIRTDYGVGTVDLELAPDGTVEHIGVGSNAAGIGPTLPPATNAVALRADPAFDASTGDIVQVWEADSMRRVLTGELRGVAGDVVTVAINSADTPKVDPTREYRLVTLPVKDRPAREFASLLRAAEESFASVTVEAGSPLHGLPVGAVRLTVVSVRPEGSEPLTLPSREYVLSPGDLVFAIGTPRLLRKLDRATEPLDPSVASTMIIETDEAQTEDGEQAGFDGRTDQSVDRTDDSEQPKTPETTEPTPEAPDSPSSPDPADSSQSEPATAGTADKSSFDELKSDYESGVDWDEDDEEESETESIEELAGGDSDSDGTTDSSASFDELKTEFESGDADWSDDTADESVAAEQSANDESSDESLDDSDDLMSLDEADISFEEKDEDDGDGLEAAGFDDDIEDGGLDAGFDTDEFEDDTDDGPAESDDLSSLDVDEAEDRSEIEMDESDGESLFDDDPLADDSLFEEAEEPLADEDTLSGDESETAKDNEEDDDETEDDEADDSDDTDDGDDDSGGGTSFAQLKEEFESGDADWEDDISDSPGGDMRLDE